MVCVLHAFVEVFFKQVAVGPVQLHVHLDAR